LAAVTVPLVGSDELRVLVDAVAAEGRGVDLAGVVVRSGWENVVLETRDGWILRFPRSEEVAFDREVAILRRVHGRLPAETPDVAWVGRQSRFAAYRKLAGAALDWDAYQDAPDGVRDGLASSLAGFLIGMHDSFDAQEAAGLGLPVVDHAREADQIAAGMDRIPGTARPFVEELLDRFRLLWVDDGAPGPDVVLHNDFHTGNLVLAEPLGELTAVWDFSCVQKGRPSFDFRYFAGDSGDLADRMARNYERITGRRIDLAAAVVANQAEQVLDALTTGQEHTITALAEVGTRPWADDDE
jgi:aminoglycoside phosphotransferase (APT) family kinase protein